MTGDTHLILADHDEPRARQLIAALHRLGWRTRWLADPHAASEAIRATQPPVALIEARWPGVEVAELWRSLTEGEGLATQVVLMVEHGDLGSLRHARSLGAVGVLERPFDAEALAVILHQRRPRASALPEALPELAQFLERMGDRARQENPLLEHVTDPTTGLYNEAYTALKLADEFKKARRFEMPLTCVLLGLDDAATLSSSPDALHTCVNEVAGLLLCESRDIDHLARVSPTEFLVLLTGTPTTGGQTMAERILASLASRALRTPGARSPITASAGIATFPSEAIASGEDLLHRAREARQAAQRVGGNRVAVHGTTTLERSTPTD